MATIRICDLCHEKILEGGNPRKFRIKVQEKKTFINHFEHEAWSSWETIDVHSGCAVKLFEEAKKQSGEQK